MKRRHEIRLLALVVALSAGQLALAAQRGHAPEQVCMEGSSAKALAACSALLEDAVAGNDRALLLYRRASLLMQRGQLEPALADLDQAITLWPQALSSFRLRATVRARLGLAEGAQEDVRAAVRLSSEQDVEALLWAANALEDPATLIDPKPAARILTVDPQQAARLNTRCWERTLLGRELEAAHADCALAAKLAPAEAGVHDSLGLVLYRLNRHAESIAAYTQALALDSESPVAAQSYYVRGLAHRAIGEQAQADEDIAQAFVLHWQVAAYFRQFGIQ